MSEWIAVIGRFVPVGESTQNVSDEAKERPRLGALLREGGEPICRTVKLERIVPDEPESTPSL